MTIMTCEYKMLLTISSEALNIVPSDQGGLRLVCLYFGQGRPESWHTIATSPPCSNVQYSQSDTHSSHWDLRNVRNAKVNYHSAWKLLWAQPGVASPPVFLVNCRHLALHSSRNLLRGQSPPPPFPGSL